LINVKIRRFYQSLIVILGVLSHICVATGNSCFAWCKGIKYQASKVESICCIIFGKIVNFFKKFKLINLRISKGIFTAYLGVKILLTWAFFWIIIFAQFNIFFRLSNDLYLIYCAKPCHNQESNCVNLVTCILKYFYAIYYERNKIL
jgi:hypothetical protein